MWTVIRGEMFVACELGCLPLPLEGLAPYPDGEKPCSAVRDPLGTGEGVGGTGTCEGGDAAVSVPRKDELPF